MNIIKNIFDFILPRECVVCFSHLRDSKRDFICNDCLNKIEAVQYPYCKVCGRPFISKETLEYSPEHLCFKCREKRFYFNSARAAGVYSGILKELIHIYKFQKKRALGKLLSEIMITNLNNRFEKIDFDTIIPVPLHKKRLRERGFDQSLLLGINIGKQLEIPILTDNLIRYRDTKPQLELKVNERFKNVRDAFKVIGKEKIKDKNILLIDDVFTTGATVNECSRILKKEGARKVDVFVLSRTC